MHFILVVLIAVAICLDYLELWTMLSFVMFLMPTVYPCTAVGCGA